MAERRPSRSRRRTPNQNQPIYPFTEAQTGYYWEHVNLSYVAVAELRFNGSYELRYDVEEDGPSTNFSTRFSGREDRVALYAMAARQPDPLSEYLLLYRILEAADSSNGKSFIASHLDELGGHDFGRLWVSRDAAINTTERVNAFDVYIAAGCLLPPRRSDGRAG